MRPLKLGFSGVGLLIASMIMFFNTTALTEGRYYKIGYSLISIIGLAGIGAAAAGIYKFKTINKANRSKADYLGCAICIVILLFVVAGAYLIYMIGQGLNNLQF